MTPIAYDWSEFSITFFYPVPISVAYGAWATASGLESFFVESAAFLSPSGSRRQPDDLAQSGDCYEWTWRHGASVAGVVNRSELNSLLDFTFGSMNCVVTFDTADELTTMVRLAQDGIASDAEGQVMGHLNCRSCWVFFMTNLKAVLMAGTDLRDEDPARASSMEVGYERP